jgi:hypothetical protein
MTDTQAHMTGAHALVRESAVNSIHEANTVLARLKESGPLR